MSDTLLAYLAGALDADGYFTISRSTYHRRVRGDAGNAIYSEEIGLRQVEPAVPQLLLETFGGSVSTSKGYKPNSRPTTGWQVTQRKAASACSALLPYLRIKKRHAELLLQLRATHVGEYEKAAYWFQKDFPEWARMQLVTVREAARMLHYKDTWTVSQAIHNGTILALPYRHDGVERPRIPQTLIERLLEQAGKDGWTRLQAPQLVAWRHRLFLEVRELNKRGLDGTSTYHRTGYHKPLD